MKRLKFFVASFIFMLMPISVYANTSTYYIEANIKENGDMEVKELKVLDGSYNGVLTTLRYKNTALQIFSGVKDDFEGSSIYNASDLVDLRVYDVNFNNKSFNSINNINREFDLVSYAEKGDYGVYTKTYDPEGYDLTIYLPSSYKKASLVTYTLKDVVVVHNDVAEIAWDFIGTDYEEDIDDLKIVVNLPKESNELRVFSHGPLNGENRIIDKSSVELTYPSLYKYNAVDMRVVFDKDIVPNATKKSNIDGLEYILEVEKERAEIANEEREEARRQEAIINGIITFLKVLSVGWLIGLIVIVYKIYNKYDKEYKSEFNAKYLRDIPSEYPPTTVSYLMYKTVNQNSFIATILDLITKKVLILSEEQVKSKKLFSSKDKKNYRFTLNKNADLSKLNPAEKEIIELLINTIGDNNSVTVEEIDNYSKEYSDAKNFMLKYDTWQNSATSIALNEEFYENVSSAKTKGVLYSVIMPAISILSYAFNLNLGFAYAFNLFAVVAIFYFFTINKKTKKGNEEYKKWKALNNYLNDFGRLSEKELPEITLWEKYLVYAMVFGIADKVQKAMKVNLQNMNYDDNTMFTYLYFDNLHFYNTLARTVNNSVLNARQTISRHEMASSSNSSSGGFGGGSSFGGGGFGGGGSGGGRF